MKSSSGEYYPALDHIRALAAFLVFTWHFTHNTQGTPVPFHQDPVFLFSIFDEGYTGVALFMTLSGYLFAKLLKNHHIDYRAFYWNRFIRLAPLLFFMFIPAGFLAIPEKTSLTEYLTILVSGLVTPNWPNGGWSITVETHFYALLPIVLFIIAKSRNFLLSIIFAMILARIFAFAFNFDVQYFAYFTLIGRLDQFILGMAAYHFSIGKNIRAWTMILALAGFLLFFDLFNRTGGYNEVLGQSNAAIWIILPTIEGAFYAVLIAWYDNLKITNKNWASKQVAKAGRYSYSIYLLHFFFVFAMADFVHESIMPISNYYLAFAWSIIGFIFATFIAAISYKLIEKPFLAYRRPYILDGEAKEASHEPSYIHRRSRPA